MTISIAFAGYLPQAMIVRIGAALPIYDHSKNVLNFADPQAFGIFFHEYAHFVHNISTISGIAAFINTIELWRCFRNTMQADGSSAGSNGMEPTQALHLATLLSYLGTTRRNNSPSHRLIRNPVSLTVTSCDQSPVVESDKDTLASALTCMAQLTDHGGQTEQVAVTIGTLELLECAAWLLEKRVVTALSQPARAAEAPIFPYKVAVALSEFLAPGIDEDGILACILAALQSSDAPAAFPEVLAIALRAIEGQNDPVSALRQSVQNALSENRASLEAMFSSIEEEFSGDGLMAVAIRQIVASARAAFERRAREPFFELLMIEQLKSGSSVETILRQIPSCALKQETGGPDDQLQRDFLVSFLPQDGADGRDPEDGLRVIHTIFDYLGRHCLADGFAATENARRGPCPFSTCCNLQLRIEAPEVCLTQPWQSARWPNWKQEGTCWYGTGVSITRPPD